MDKINKYDDTTENSYILKLSAKIESAIEKIETKNYSENKEKLYI
jgi:hypothetical protein